MKRLLLLFFAAASVSAQRLCADFNTAETGPSTDIYQSAGSCSKTCNGQYAYAVVQSSSCWCTNYSPDESTQRDGCNVPCPGYPTDMCGGTGRYSYVLLNQGLVLGTKGGPAKQPAESKTTSPAAKIDEPTSSTSTSEETTLTVQSRTPSPITTTIGGTVTTVTVVPTQVTVSATPEPVSPDNGGMPASTVVGIVIGCIVAVALIALGVVFFFLYSKRTKERNNGERIGDAGGLASAWRGFLPASRNPFADNIAISSMNQTVYGRRDWSGSIESIRPRADQCLRITNPDPPEK